jgi:hypothetical protein
VRSREGNREEQREAREYARSREGIGRSRGKVERE